MKNVVQSRQRCCNKAMQAPTTITTTKLCACTSGNRPATTPAAIIRLTDRGTGEMGNEERDSGDADTRFDDAWLACCGSSCSSFFCFFPCPFPLFPCSPLAPAPLAAALLVCSSESHHCVKRMTASGKPSRKPRCGINKVETAFPQ